MPSSPDPGRRQAQPSRAGVDRHRCSADNEDQLQGTAGDWRAALDNAGTWLRGFRHRASRRIAGSRPPSGTHSQTYTDVGQPFLNNPAPGHRTQQGPLTAAALGLPIPYSDHQGPRDSNGEPAQRKATVDVHMDGESARRASPLWLRVRHDGTAWRLRSLAFHSEWLPPAPTSPDSHHVRRPVGPVDRPQRSANRRRTQPLVRRMKRPGEGAGPGPPCWPGRVTAWKSAGVVDQQI